MKTLNNRLLSLDFFRGLTVMAMILVNNPGSWGHIYAPLEHAKWNGCTPTDLIFPFFLFIVGVSIAFAMHKGKTDRTLQPYLIKKAAKRAVILFLLQVFSGVIFIVWKDPVAAFANLRIPGVLARIAVVFFISAGIYLKCSRKAIIWIIAIILCGYYLAMNFIPVPGQGYPSLEAGKDLGAWVDRTILGTQHLWKFAKTWDPEGLFSTLPAIATCLIGVLTGMYIRKEPTVATATDVAHVRAEGSAELDVTTYSPQRKVRNMLIAGLLLIVGGLLFNFIFPINKSLWTSSYVLYTAGWALVILGASYWVIDYKGIRGFTLPFVVFGVNAITAFFLSGLLPRFVNLFKVATPTGEKIGAYSYYYQYLIKPHFAPKDASLVSAITVVLFFFILCYILYRKKIFIKV